jgi:hypothetical protein
LPRVRGSGCGVQKGDLASKGLHVEAKSTRMVSTGLPNAWFRKAVAQAKRKIPIVQFAFTGPVRNLDVNRWVFIREKDALAAGLIRANPEWMLNRIGETNADRWNRVSRHMAVVGKMTAHLNRDGVRWVAVPEWWFTPNRIEALERISNQ